MSGKWIWLIDASGNVLSTGPSQSDLGLFQRDTLLAAPAAGTRHNIEAIWLLRRLSPDFKTIADFRRSNGAAIAGRVVLS
jgi:hypothetical protein